jgi:hypothetical protein
MTTTTTKTKPCTRRGCYAQRDGESHAYFGQDQEQHGICVADNFGRREFARPESWPDGWSVRLLAVGDEPWRVDVVVHAKTFPAKAAPACAFADYTIPNLEGLAAALGKAEDLRKRLERATR